MRKRVQTTTFVLSHTFSVPDAVSKSVSFRQFYFAYSQQLDQIEAFTTLWFVATKSFSYISYELTA